MAAVGLDSTALFPPWTRGWLTCPVFHPFGGGELAMPEGTMAGGTRNCGKCDQRPAGPGGVLCPECRQLIEGQLANWLSALPAFVATEATEATVERT
jgi:hypothetical protein